jgi:uncharacterized membrane protein YccC
MTAGARSRAPARLAGLLSGIIAGTMAGTIATLQRAGPGAVDTRPARRDLIRRSIALNEPIYEAIAESSDLHYRRRGLLAAQSGLFQALSAWRTIASHLRGLPDQEARREAARIIAVLPPAVRDSLAGQDQEAWIARPAIARDACEAASRQLVALTADRPSPGLLANQMAKALRSVARAANAMALLTAPAAYRPVPGRGPGLRGMDPLPALVNAIRILVTIVSLDVFWVLTAWSSGPTAVQFAAISIIVASPKQEQGYAMAANLVVAVVLAAVLGAVCKFAVLPPLDTFPELCLALALFLVPICSLAVIPRFTPVFGRLGMFILAFIAPSNPMSYDTSAFYNQTLSMLVGFFVGAIALCLIPPVPSTVRTQRLLTATLNDLRTLAASRTPPSRTAWEARIHNRLLALPQAAEPVDRARLTAALAVGTAIIRLKLVADRFGLRWEIVPFLAAVARGDEPAAAVALAAFDRALAVLPPDRPGARIRLRARSGMQVVAEALEAHADYFSR